VAGAYVANPVLFGAHLRAYPLGPSSRGTMMAVRFLEDRAAAARLRERLDAAGFTLDGLTERLGPHAFAHLAGRELAPLIRATRGGDRLDTLLRLFVIGVPVPRSAVVAALSPFSVDELAAASVVSLAGGEVRGRLALRPLDSPENWLVAHDRPPATGHAVPADHVLGVSASTMALAGATIRRSIRRAFDLGTGCGIQALHASTHSQQVVASDVNPRAVALSSLTMELNALGDDVTVRFGDLFGPVADETFELIVANPPFVISPSRRYLFRDSESAVDELCRTLVRAAPAHLAEGGHCQLLASWAHVVGESWRDRLAGWFDGIGCDALVLAREVLAPDAHAAGWLRQTEPADRWGPEYDRWMAYYERHGIEAVGLGLVTMRKRATGEGWIRVEDAAQDFAMPCGDHLGAAFELADFLDAHEGDRLLDAILRVAPDVVLDERARPARPGWSVTDRRLRQTAGLCREGEVDDAVAAIVAACDGTRPLGVVLRDAASDAGTPGGRVFARAALPVIRRLVEQGFLLPAVA
jgi:methylase of polypeptide subunit release factors